MKTHNLTALALAISVAASSQTLAQTQDVEEIRLEEIVVTSQKREENLMDVPISVNAMAGEKIEDTGITGIERMADYIPSLNMTQTGIGTTISIRGISSGVNQGFEQSAAQYVDGVHFGRAQLSRAPFLDIERVEVLRGPQSILFGKNSTAGAISITTARPTDEFEAKVSGLYEPEHGEQDLRAVVSGPLTDELSGRLAVLDRSIDGHFHNTTLNRDETREEDQVIRGTLLWQPNSQWDVTLKLEDGSFDQEGRNLEVVNPVQIDLPGRPTLPYSAVLAGVTGALSGGQNIYQLDTTQDYQRQSNGDFSYNNTQNGMLEVETELGELSFTSVTGYTAYDYEELCDCDFVGVPLFNILSMEDYSQWSQEFRIASPQSGPFSYLGGLFYQTSDLDFDDAIRVPSDSVLLPALEQGGVAGATNFFGTASRRNFDQESDIAAVFFQGTWELTPDLRVIAGGRYTDEEKTASRRQYHTAPDGSGGYTEVPVGTPGDPINVFYGLFNIEPYETLSETRSESNFTPSLTFQYDLNSTDMIYASYTTGFKSGGFDVRSNSHPNPMVNNAVNASVDPSNPQPIVGVFEFEDEEVKNYELGGKFVLAGGRAELNAALFHTDFQDLQTSQFDGAFSFNVTNAAEATIQGLEVDGRWMLSDSLLLSGGFAYLDFEYDDFPTAQCYFGQAPGQTQCDASGKSREFTPELQGNLSANHTAELGRGLTLSSTLDLIYSDEYLTTPTLDPRMVQDSYVKVNARVALSGRDDRWELALIGKNLTDEDIVSYANGLPVATVLTQGTGTGYYAFYERPRSIALQGTLRF
ncbi:TonB-dependent receptor [Marinimicrobium agarilyticum]|uniref:TonB-dependent receptor n=1 Tax=Marinimicrobium agarilyticum TaxID=306546 RepID=UPI001FE0F8EB|nr:TonB-dependent receptor [Marinimicrobium agarilyticum]